MADIDYFEDEYWKYMWGFEQWFEMSSYGMVRRVGTHEEIDLRYNRVKDVLEVYVTNGHELSYGWAPVYMPLFFTFWKTNPWAIPDFKIEYRDGDSQNLHIFNLAFWSGDKPLRYTLDENTGFFERRRARLPRRVRIIETGEEFESVPILAEAIGGSANVIYLCLRGKQETHKGYRFEWVDPLG